MNSFGWMPDVVTQIDDVLAEVFDAYSMSPADSGSCTLLVSDISIPPSSFQIAYWAYCADVPTVKQVDMV